MSVDQGADVSTATAPADLRPTAGTIDSPRRTLRLLWAILAFAVALALAVISMLTLRALAQEDRLADERIARSLTVLHEHTEKVFRAAGLVMAQVAEDSVRGSDEQIRQQEADWYRKLHRIAEELPQVHSAWIVDRDGYPLASSYVQPVPRDRSLKDRDFFTVQTEKDSPSFVGRVLSPRLSTAPPFFSLSRRRETGSGVFAGVVTVSLLPSEFERFYASLGANEPGSLFALLRQDGEVLARFPGAVRPDGGDAPAEALVRQMATAPDTGFVTSASPIDGKERRLGYRRVEGYPVYVVAGYETATIRSAGWAAASPYLVAGLPATALIALALLFTIIRMRRVHRQEAALATARLHSQKLEALGTLTGGIAHDFNNLLMVISGAADRLERRPRDDSDRRYLGMIRSASQSGEQLTRQLLSFSRRQHISPVVIDVGRRLHELTDMLGQTLRENIKVSVNAPEGRDFVSVDTAEFELAIINLATNARDAMPDGGRLTVTVVDDPGGGEVEISLADEGMGIAAEDLTRIFDPFYSTKGKAGTGLGLSQVYGFVQQAGGHIEVNSEPGLGTTFLIRLPRCAAPAGTAMQQENLTGRSPLSGRAILIVEDDANVADICVSYAEQLGMKPVRYEHGPAALAALDTGYVPDIVVSDILLPKRMNGVVLATEIRRRMPHVPVLLITGYSGSTRAEAGPFPILDKPFTLDEFASRMTELWQSSSRRSA